MNKNGEKYLRFIQKHDYPRLKALNEFRLEGGHIRTKTAHEIYRKYYKVEKNKYRGKPPSIFKSLKQYVNDLKNGYSSKVNLIDIKKQETFQLKNHNGTPNQIVIDILKSIWSAYGITDVYAWLKVNIIIESDEYTDKHRFGVFMPLPMNRRIGVKKLGKEIVSQMLKFYDWLLIRYTDKKSAYTQSILYLKKARAMINKSKNLNYNTLKEIFSANNIILKDMEGILYV